MSERYTEKIQVLTTKSQKDELENNAKKEDMSQGEIVREALELLFEQWRSVVGKD